MCSDICSVVVGVIDGEDVRFVVYFVVDGKVFLVEELREGFKVFLLDLMIFLFFKFFEVLFLMLNGKIDW